MPWLSLVVRLGAVVALATGIDLANIDPNYPACRDFYDFAVGGWIAHHPVPRDRGAFSSFNALSDHNEAIARGILERAAANPSATGDEKKIGDLYASCIDETAIERAGVAPLEPPLAQIEATDASSLSDELARLHDVGISAFWNAGSTIDQKNSSRQIAALGPAGLTLPNREFYLSENAALKRIRERYAAHIAQMFEMLGDDRARAASEATSVIALETELAAHQLAPADRRDPERTYHPEPRAALTAMVPRIGWDRYFVQRRFPAFDVIDVSEPEYLRSLEGLLAKTPLADVKTYLRWRLLTQSAPALPARFAEAAFTFSKSFSGAQEQAPRAKRCTSVVDRLMGDALGQMWLAAAFSPQAKARAEEMVRTITATLADDLRTLGWMSEPTRHAALGKLAALFDKIGYPNHWRDYSTLTITRDAYLANLRAGDAYRIAEDVARINKPVDRGAFRMTPATVNAYYSPQRNEIVFPAGILQPPFFNPDADDAVNYGAIGAVIGHEMTHGFDDHGRRFDAQGNLRDWWTPKDAASFKARAGCIVDQFDAYVATEDVHLNGRLVQGEAIADLGGLTIAYKAFERASAGKPRTPIDGYTPEQRFFLAFAQIFAASTTPEYARTRALTDPHPLARYRVIGTLSNMPEFAQAFGCKAGDAMVRPPNQRCRIW